MRGERNHSQQQCSQSDRYADDGRWIGRRWTNGFERAFKLWTSPWAALQPHHIITWLIRSPA